jgi:hypothetical protein
MTQTLPAPVVETRTLRAILCNGDGLGPDTRTPDGPEASCCIGCPACEPTRYYATARMTQVHADPFSGIAAVDDEEF